MRIYIGLYQVKMVSEAKWSKFGASKIPVLAFPGDINVFFPCYEKLMCDHQGIKDLADHCTQALNKQGTLKFSHAQR